MPKFDTQKLKKLKFIDRLLKWAYVFPRNIKPVIPLNKLPLNEILIIAKMMIGDTIMLIPCLRVLKRSFPGAKITIVGAASVRLILEGQLLVDNFFTARNQWLDAIYLPQNLLRLMPVIRNINKTKYDLAIDFRGDWRNIFLMNFLNAKRKVSFNYSGGEYMLTDIIPPDPSKKHYIDEWLYLLACIGCKPQGGDKFPVLHLSEKNKQFLTGFVSSHKLNNKFIIGVHPGASLADRKWQEQKYADVIKNVAIYYSSCAFLLFQGPGEENTVKEIENLLRAKDIQPRVVNETLENYITIISCCNLLICNDSGAGHIAAAFSIPSVIILGSADPETIMPYNKNYLRIISHRNSQWQTNPNLNNQELLSSIKVDEVNTAVTGLMDILGAVSKN